MSQTDIKADEVSYYIKLAIEQYSEATLSFFLDKCQYSQLPALCVGMKNGYIVFRSEISELEKNPLVWGTEVGVYFSVRDVQMVPCEFRSRLSRLSTTPPNHVLLIMPAPAHMDHNQRRYSRRVNLPEEEEKNFKVWLGNLSGGNLESLPQWKWTNLDERGLSVEEISANGLRMGANKDNPLLAKIEINDTILLKGNFGTRTKKLELFIIASVARKMPKLNTEDMMSIGCHFRAWRKVDAGANQTWFRADSHDGIASVAQWLSRNFHNVNN